MTNVAKVSNGIKGASGADLLKYASQSPENREKALGIMRNRLSRNEAYFADTGRGGWKVKSNRKFISQMEEVSFESDPTEAPATEEPTVVQTAGAADAHAPVDYLRASLNALAERVGSRDKAIVDLYENVDKREAVGKVIGMKITQSAIAEACGLHPQRIAQILKAHREALAAPAHVVDMEALKAALLG